MSPRRPMLIVLSGLPGSGKTTVARELARQIGGVHLRVDTIEHAIANYGHLPGAVNELGYRIACAVAADNLRLGNTVITDSVNPIVPTREAWRDVAKVAGVSHIEVEVFFSDPAEHQRRVETRVPDIEGFTGPPGKKSSTASTSPGSQPPSEPTPPLNPRRDRVPHSLHPNGPD